MPLDEANVLFAKQKMTDKISLFRYRGSSMVNVYNLDGYYDYYYGFMLPSTGYVKHFDLQRYENGLVLILPNKKNPVVLEVERDMQETLLKCEEITLAACRSYPLIKRFAGKALRLFAPLL